MSLLYFLFFISVLSSCESPLRQLSSDRDPLVPRTLASRTPPRAPLDPSPASTRSLASADPARHSPQQQTLRTRGLLSPTDGSWIT
ncbi:hypothetical protein GGG16DRAFT_92358 [Schizophyllum commune]